jgi:hypothetical protein
MDISSVAVAKGVFNGVGRIVEIPAQSGGPPNVSRDDLVYPEGTTLNPHSCLFRTTLQETRRSPALGCSPMRAAPLPARSAPGAVAPQLRRQLRGRASIAA